ncbi:LytR/AlgR family response regulator transcription factor [Taibaiella koreensis]|uniref:LytR/AlgR family response regulator transcription factor n=1 Tax=Taibaiella koreensis TaxID=1268548 RepID=UPI000E59A0A8|nr:LytTR family DNA-binding domain-containing protein [Taibaiella koreensis]
MAITCFIIDDEPASIKVLTRLIEKTPSLQLVGATTEPHDGLKFLKANKVDVVFLDIGMQKVSGLELVEMIDNRVVFVTASDGLTNDALSHPNTIDYLVKRVEFDRFVIAVKKIEANFPQKVDNTGFENEAAYPFLTDAGVQNIAFSRIIYIEAKGYYTSVYYDESSSAKLTLKLKDIESIFPSSIFARVHRGFIVNKKKIVKTKYDEVELIGGISLSVSRSYRDNLLL